MTFRYARHTNDINLLVEFYQNILGLELLGTFQNHDGYDGVFLGKKGVDWHLEFTQSDEKVSHQFNEDDHLVFYLDSQAQITAVLDKVKEYNIPIKVPKNPYWRRNGQLILDPDGMGIVITKRSEHES